MAHHFRNGCSRPRCRLITGILAGISVGLALLACGLPPVSKSPELISTDADLHPAATPGTHIITSPLPKGKLLSILPSGELGEEVRDLALDGKGQLWVATHIGLGVWDGEQWETYHSATSPLPHDDVRAVATAPDGETVWIGTADGIARIDDEGWTVFTHENSDLSSPVINDLAFAKDGTLWAATSFGGVAFYDGEMWTCYDKYNSGLLGVGVSSLAIGPDGHIWMVDDFGDGVSAFDGQHWIQYGRWDSTLGGAYMRRVAVDNEGYVWLGSYEGIVVFDGKTGDPCNLAPLPQTFGLDYPLTQGEDGRVWAASVQSQGVVVQGFTASEMIAGQAQAYPPLVITIDDVPTIPHPKALLHRSNGTWLATSDGLLRLYPDGAFDDIPLPNPQPGRGTSPESTGNPVPEFVQVYEFHPDRIRVIAIGTIEVWNSYESASPIQPLCDRSWGPDLYNPQDVTELVISENITICEGTNLDCWFRPTDPPSAGERFTYWMSEVVHRLPHLHTPNTIEPEQEYHFGARASQPAGDEHWVRIVAFPVSADITKVHGTPPTSEVTVEDWRLFVYNVRESNRPHVNFILHNDTPPPPLEAYLEAADWQFEDKIKE